MTLDEWKAKNVSSEVPKLEIRKITEGVSDLFKGAKQLTKDTEGDAYFVGKVCFMSLISCLMFSCIDDYI